MTFDLYPQPQKIKIGKNISSCRTAKWIILPSSASDRLRKQTIIFAEDVKVALSEKPLLSCGKPASGRILLEIVLNAAQIPEQAYELEIKQDSISLKASSDTGAYYGLLTLKQILTSKYREIPCAAISDSPDIPVRGVMLDVSRCKIPTMQTLLTLFKTFSHLKINQIQLYMEHSFAYSAHETAWRGVSPFTAQEIIELDLFCHEHFIELVPNQNSFGHLERWLKHDKYKYLAECPAGYIKTDGSSTGSGNVIRPNAESLKFLDGLYSELLPNFRSGFINVGCDETAELGLGFSKELCDKKGKTRVYFDFLIKIHELVRKHKHLMMFWGDIILHQPELIKELPNDIIAMNWGYEAAHPFDKEAASFAEAGIPFYVCPGTSSWGSFGGRTENCIANIANAAENGIKHGAKGLLTTDWGDGGHHQYQPVTYLGFFCGAIYSWAYKSNKSADIEKGLNKIFFKDNSGVSAKLFMEMGRLLECFKPRLMNEAVFVRWFRQNFANSANYQIPEINTCLAKIENLFSSSAEMRPETDDAEIIRAEFRNGLRMMKLALERELAFKNALIETNVYKIHAIKSSDLETIADQHRELWLARNRVGGLEESIKKLFN